MAKYCVAITIGPIIETLNLSSRPASLWCASAMFSWLTEDICNKALAEFGDNEINIISPYYAEQTDSGNYSVMKDGVGKYHDRIYFTLSEENTESLRKRVDKIIKGAKEGLSDSLLSEKLLGLINCNRNELNKIILNYIQVHFIIENVPEKTDVNCILRLSGYLDTLELNPTFQVDQSIRPINTLFEGRTEETHNELVKQCFGIGKNKTSLTYKDEKDNKIRVKDIGKISDFSPESNNKIFDYYAVVQADGDRMGKVLETMHTDAEVKIFSENCLSYTGKAAEIVNAYGGVTIYAGGDDLLFIAPLVGNSVDYGGEAASNGTITIFQLCAVIRKCFSEKFIKPIDEKIKGMSMKPSLSFGISVNYEKFPLYEALKDALELLEQAKKVSDNKMKKDKTAVHIRKNSGQSAMFRFENDGIINKTLDTLIKPDMEQKVLMSMLYKIGLYRTILIAGLENDSDINKIFDNLFDSSYHKITKVNNYINEICKSLRDLYKFISEKEERNYLLQDMFDKKDEEKDPTDGEIAVDLLYTILRIARFYSEKRGKDNGIISYNT